MEEAGTLIVTVEAEDADSEELEDLTRDLLREIRSDTDVETADLSRTGEAPAGAKGTMSDLGTLVVQTLPTALPGLLTVLRGWTLRRRDPRVKVLLKLRSGSIDVEYPVGSMTHEDLMDLVEVVRGAPGSDPPRQRRSQRQRKGPRQR